MYRCRFHGCPREFTTKQGQSTHQIYCEQNPNRLKRTARQMAAARENIQAAGNASMSSIRRQGQLLTEEAMADSLREEGFEVFSPTVVCDRIAIRDGEVYFAEFKKVGQTLRLGQQKVADIVGDKYLIRYHSQSNE